MNAALPPQPTDLGSALADVRHAYRIVAAYQQRLFFLLRQIEAGFPELHLAYWQPAEYSRPPHGKTKPWAKWGWDFLPYYSSMNILTRDGAPFTRTLGIGDWFIMVRFVTDSGFDTDIEKSPSFSGPDPIKMQPVEETETMIFVNLYQVTGPAGKDKTPLEIINADTSDDWEYLVWHEIREIGARCLTIGGNLADHLEAGAIKRMISELRERLLEEGILHNPAKRPTKRSVSQRK